MRGTLRTGGRAGGFDGIIPAHAGNTSPANPPSSPARDHPRACGEHRMSIVSTAPLVGSSPRMRGTLGLRLGRVPVLGIIPAHAGNTGHRKSTTAWTKDHPRACGEHSRRLTLDPLPHGSSPRMRGTLTAISLAESTVGIIPAHAGNTDALDRDLRVNGDHPRACGEHPLTICHSMPCTGSSPRMRGTHVVAGTPLSVSGIIPAHAGNTGMRVIICRFAGDHPRACGEHSQRKRRFGTN